MKIGFNQKIKTGEVINYWVTSDLHFGHHNILKFCPKTRPWATVEEMNEALISHWNSKVHPRDVVFHLGDFSFYGVDLTKEIIARLNGTIIFVLGNHDKSLDQIPGLQKFRYLELRVDGVKVVMSHYAMRAWNQQHRGAVMLFGHSHGSMPDFGRSTDVGWDANEEGGLESLPHIIEYLRQKPIQTEDGH